MIPVGPKSEKV